MNSTVLALNRWAGPALALAWPMLWQSSLLIVFLFALDFALRRTLRASVRYALWLVVLLKLALPPSLALPTGLGWWLRPAAAAPARPRQVSMVVTYGPAQAARPLAPISVARAAPPPARLSAGAWGLAASGAVSLGLLAWMLVRWGQVAREARRAAPAPDWLEQLFVQTKRLSGRRRPARLRLIERPMSPAVCGLFRPVILVPRALAQQLPPDQLGAVLLHELVHLRRGDLWLNFVQTLLQIFYWWHPLLWFANTRIRRAREEAVDDAVMLALDDNAEAYAPTLLQVARLALSRPPVSLGLVGILESGSFLRQRIERLLDFHPPRKAGLTLASVFSVAAFAALALPMGRAPAPVPKPEPPAAAEPASAPPAASSAPTTDFTDFTDGPAPALEEHRSSRSAALVQDGKLLYEMGKLDEAEAKLKEAERFDPRNDAADYYLNLIREARDEAALRRQNKTGITWTGRGRQRIARMLNGIHLDVAGPWQHLPLGEVVKILRDQSLKQDPEGRGMNFILNPNIAAIDPFTGLPITEPSEFNDISVTIEPPLRSPSLADVLDAVVMAADKPIQYSIEDYGVVFSLKGKEPTPLYFRTIKLDPSTFESSMRKFLGLPEGGNRPENLAALMRQFFREIGVDLSPPKSMFYKDRQGTLLVFATLADLDIIERAVQGLTAATPQLSIQAVFIELPKAEVEAFWEKFGPVNGPVPGGSAKVATLNQSQAAAQLDRWNSMGGTNILGQVEVTTLDGRQVQVSMGDWQTNRVEKGQAKPGAIASGLAITPQVTGEGRGVQMSLNARTLEFLGYDGPGPFVAQLTGGTNAAPSVDFLGFEWFAGNSLMGNGTNAVPDVPALPLPHFRIRQVTTGAVPVTAASHGVLLHKGGQVSVTTGAVPVTAASPLPHFSIRPVTTGAVPVTAASPLPHFCVLQAAAAVEVQDGQTVVLGNFTKEGASKMMDQVPILGDIPVVGRLFRNESGWTDEKDLLILVTPTIVDPAGNRVHPQNK
jgi:beta-lactamase regulating signal transducer with metallopeptidase domain